MHGFYQTNVVSDLALWGWFNTEKMMPYLGEERFSQGERQLSPKPWPQTAQLGISLCVSGVS